MSLAALAAVLAYVVDAYTVTAIFSEKNDDIDKRRISPYQFDSEISRSTAEVVRTAGMRGWISAVSTKWCKDCVGGIKR
jgi:hypothetical protein